MNLAASQKVLAFDFGTKRIGCAVSYGSLAEPLEIISNNDQKFARIQELIEEYGITQIVVGISENKSGERTEDFVAELKKVVAIPIELVDETLSTQVVRKKLQERGVSTWLATNKKVDHLAAAELLQEWLDTQ